MNYQNNKLGHLEVTALSKLSGFLVMKGETRLWKTWGAKYSHVKRKMALILLFCQSRRWDLCIHSRFMKNLLKPYIMCLVSAEQHWKGQTLVSDCWGESCRDSKWEGAPLTQSGSLPCAGWLPGPGGYKAWPARREPLTWANWSGHPVVQKLE